MDPYELIHRELTRIGVRLTATLPNDWVGPLIRRIDADPAIRHVPVARESEAVVVASGKGSWSFDAHADRLGADYRISILGRAASMRHQDQEAGPRRQIEHDERNLKRSAGHVSHPAKGRAGALKT